MPKAYETWTVLKHGPIEKVTESIWRVEGNLPGPPIPRVMTLVRLPDGRLVIHSAIALEEPAMKEIEAWGKPAFLIVPGIGHRLDAKVYKARYPDLTVVCPPGAKANVEEVLPVDRTEVDFGDPQVTWATFDGTGGREGVLVVRSAQGSTLVLNDMLMNMTGRLPGAQGFVMGLIGFVGPAKLPPMPRLLFVKDKAKVRAQYERLAETPDLRRIIVGHGAMVEGAPAEALRRVAASL
jgi:hypothetical protein